MKSSGKKLLELLRGKESEEREAEQRRKKEEACAWADRRVESLFSECESSSFDTTIELLHCEKGELSQLECLKLEELERRLGISLTCLSVKTSAYGRGNGVSPYCVSILLDDLYDLLVEQHAD